jgi:hyperosmotically inducible periplasmic protein
MMRLSQNLLAVSAAALALAACDRPNTTSADANGQDARAKIDRAVDRTQQKLAEAGEKTQQTLSETSERLQPKIAAAGDRIADAGGKVAADVKEAVRRDDSVTTTVTTGSSTSVTGLPAGTQAAFNDTAITTAVKAGFLKDPGLSAIKIDVDTKEGVVVLNGVAADAAAKDRATRIAQGVNGVREVRNHLSVKQG